GAAVTAGRNALARVAGVVGPPAVPARRRDRRVGRAVRAVTVDRDRGPDLYTTAGAGGVGVQGQRTAQVERDRSAVRPDARDGEGRAVAGRDLTIRGDG